MTQPIKKIVWAVDVYEKAGTKISRQSVKAIRALSSGTNISVQVKAVYILTTNARVEGPAENYYEQTVEALHQKVKGVGILNLMRPEVIVQPALTTRGAAKALIDYAVELDADLILVGTHGRSGASRFFIGSFAESLLLHSTVPVFIIGAASWDTHKFDHIIFPTDFSERSEFVFKQVLALADQLKSRITIMHVMQPPLIVPLGAAETERGNKLRQSYMKADKDKYRALANAFADLARKSGIPVDILLRTSTRPVSDVILKSARSLEVTLIAMAAHSGGISATFAGSTTRQVVRGATCPVWILHERAVSKISKKAA